MASAVLFERKSSSTPESTLNAACRTVGDKAFHTEELPAKWVKIGLQKSKNHKYLEKTSIHAII